MTELVVPEYEKDAFNCPFCGAFSHMRWGRFIDYESSYSTKFYHAKCSRCEEESVWVGEISLHMKHSYARMVYPDVVSVPLPEKDMPDDVKADYKEAAKIFSHSKRGSAALLRLALQKLCKCLGEKGENINEDIRSLAKKNILPSKVINVADILRITGNNAVHPGAINESDFDLVSSKLFELLNFIVRKGITEPNELDGLYALMPENSRKSAEGTDQKNKGLN